MLIGQPFFIWCGLLVLVASCAMAWFVQRVLRVVAILSAVEHRSIMLPGFSPIKFIMMAVAMVFALIAMWFSLMRVSYDTGEKKEQREYARDVIIALDISRSMLAHDCAPHRLACAKRKIMQLLRTLHMERIGLIIFSQRACVQCPLTKDMRAFAVLLDAIDEDVLSGGGTTAIDEALLTAVKLCNRSGEQQQRLLIVMTDGEDFSRNLDHAREAVRQAGLHVSVLGVGTAEGAPIPVRDSQGTLQGHQRDEQGNLVISRLQPALLQNIAQSCGGKYYSADIHSNNDIQQLVQWIQQHDVVECGVHDQEVRGELFMAGAGVAAGMLLIAWLL